MKEQVLAHMDALGCAPSLRRLVAQLPDPTRIVVKPGRADWLPLAATGECVAGVYMDVHHLHLLLTPHDARDVSVSTGCRVTKTNQSTGYLHLTAEEAADEAHVAIFAAALERALLRSGTRLGNDSPEDIAVARRSSQRICRDTGLEVPVTGICDDHGVVCP